jgi:ribosome biogenesis SPOUT family RNA methylase Rps3
LSPEDAELFDVFLFGGILGKFVSSHSPSCIMLTTRR